MSSHDTDSEGQFDPSRYSTTHGSVTREIDVADDEHALKEALGQSDHREFKYDPRITGSRFAFRYEDPSAAIREYLANAETACIRRARYELSELDYADDVLDEMPVGEILDLAEEEADYSPIIEVYHSHHQSDLPDLVIADNGIGISVEEYQVLEHVGMSASHDEGDMLGQFGQGVMSGFILVGKHGDFTFLTWSRKDGANYQERLRIDGANDMPGTREAYGTTFRFPSFCAEARSDLDVRESVELLTEGMRIPVLYQEFDASGSEVFNEDYPPTDLRENFVDDDPVLVYEDDAVEAVASPEANHWKRTPKTYLVSMPIDRNDEGSRSRSRSSIWHFDLRIKYEDGRVYECDCPDADHEGLVPIAQGSWERLPEDRRDNFIVRDELDNETDVLMPKPVDDRDRLKSGHGDFYQRVSEHIDNAMYEPTREILEGIVDDGIDALFDRPAHERSFFFKGYQRYGHRTPISDRQEVQEHLEDGFDLDVPLDICSRLSAMLLKVHTVPRDSINPDLKGFQDEVPIWRVIVRAGREGDIYMGVTINSNKFEVVKALHDDNQVVALDKASDYDDYEDVFGWKKLKEIKLQSLDEQFPNLDDSIIETYGTTRSSSSNSSSQGTQTSQTSQRAKNPGDRMISVRRGTGHNQYSRYTAQRVHDTLDSGDAIQVSYRGRVEQLLVLRETEGYTASSLTSYARCGVGRAVVPNYIADFLEGADNTYASVDELRSSHESKPVSCYDISPYLEADSSQLPGDLEVSAVDESSGAPAPQDTRLGQLDDSTLILVVGEDSLEPVRDAIETPDPAENVLGAILDSLHRECPDVSGVFAIGQIDSLVVETMDTLQKNYLALSNHVDSPDRETPVVARTASAPSSHVLDPAKWDAQDGEIFLNHELPPEVFPRDSDEWYLITHGASQALRNYTSKGQALIETLQQLPGDEDGVAFTSGRK